MEKSKEFECQINYHLHKPKCEEKCDMCKEIEKECESTKIHCKHKGDEILHQGNGFVYKTCADCGDDI